MKGFLQRILHVPSTQGIILKIGDFKKTSRGNLISKLITLKSTIQQHRSLWCLSCSFFAFFVTFFVGCNKRWKIWLSDNCCQGPPYTSTLYMFSIPDLDNNTARLWRAARWVWIFLFLIITDTVAIFSKIVSKTYWVIFVFKISENLLSLCNHNLLK